MFSLQSRILLKFAAGLLGGLISWYITVRSGWLPSTQDPFGLHVSQHQAALRILASGIVGLIVGACCGCAEGLPSHGVLRRFRIILATMLGGFVGGSSGSWLARLAFLHVHPDALGGTDPVGDRAVLVASVLALSLTWGITGAGIGIASGGLRRTAASALKATAGGLIGGIIGGAILEAINACAVDSPFVPAIGFALVGASIGLFTGMGVYAFQSRILRVKPAGRPPIDHPLDTAWTTIGSGLSADVDLPSDPDVQSLHCLVQVSGGVVAVRPVLFKQQGMTSLTNVHLNGKPVEVDARLANGDVLRIGRTTIEVVLSATEARPGDRDDFNIDGQREEPSVSNDASSLHPISDVSQPTPNTVAVEPVLVCTAGPSSGAIYPLPKIAGQCIELGRALDSQISLSRDRAVSRRHAAIALSGGAYTIEDTSSQNGTYVNGAMVPAGKPSQLYPGDVIRVGDTILRFT